MSTEKVKCDELYTTTFATALKELKENQEWIVRYKKYSDVILNTKEAYKDARRKFGYPKNLDIYLSVSLITLGKTKNYDVRHNGQSVATLSSKTNNKGTNVFIKPKTKNNTCYYPTYLEELRNISGSIEWKNSAGAKLFRKFFADSSKRKDGNWEHNIESQLLRQFSLKKSKGKHLTLIQPVELCGERFQMPTPFGACKAKDGTVTYAGKGKRKGKGGGIDILARQGTGKGTHLTVIEVKDENKKNEPPEKAIAQAIAYAIFLRTLLRTKDAAPASWWKLFGFNGKIPQKLKIKVVVAMPYKKDSDTSFAKESLKFELSGDSLELHYIYFNIDDNNIITGVEATSLR